MRSTDSFGAAGIAACLIFAAPLGGQVPAPDPTGAAAADTAETIGYRPDATRRMTVPVNISGRGPYDFVVDTGSERTVISSELARELALGPGRTAVVHSMSEVSRIATVIIPGLRFGARTIADIHAPSLARRDLGAVGMLGVDSLQRHRVIFDFERREMTIMPSRTPEGGLESNEVVVTGRNRFGRLMLVDASIDGQRVYVIIDTGSQVTIANGALRRRLERRNRLGAMYPIELTSVTGGRIPAEYTLARQVRIGGVDIVNLPIAFADVHPFRLLGLENRPAILLGMDALQLFDRVSVDFANRRVRLLRPDSSMLAPVPQLARAAHPRVAG